MTTDFQSLISNRNLQTSVGFSFWNDVGELEETVIHDGLLLQGFNKSFDNNFSEILPQTSLQKNISKIKNLLNLGLATLGKDDLINTGQSLSLFQTAQEWQNMNCPPFSIQLLYFDSMGTGYTVDYARLFELSQIPRIDYANGTQSGVWNFSVQPPQGYSVKERDSKEDESTINKTFGLTATGLASVHIGLNIHLSDLIITGVRNEFSDVILNTGYPVWLKTTLTFKYWRMPDANMIMESYS